MGVNKYQLDEQDPIEVLALDNTATRAAQVAKIEQVRANRDEAAAVAALTQLTDCANDGESSECRLCCARGRCSL